MEIDGNQIDIILWYILFLKHFAIFNKNYLIVNRDLTVVKERNTYIVNLFSWK